MYRFIYKKIILQIVEHLVVVTLILVRILLQLVLLLDLVDPQLQLHLFVKKLKKFMVNKEALVISLYLVVLLCLTYHWDGLMYQVLPL